MLRVISKLSQNQNTMWMFCTQINKRKSNQENRGPRQTQITRPQTNDYDVFTKFLGAKKFDQTEDSHSLLRRSFNMLRDKSINIEEFKIILQNSLQDAFNLGDYSRLNKLDFQWMILQGHSSLWYELPILFNQKFFSQNFDYVNNIVISSVLEKARKRPDRVLGLELLKYHQQFIENNDFKFQLFHSEDQFQEFIKDLKQISYRKFDELSVYYHCFHLNQSRIITKNSVKNLVSAMTRIRWGSPKLNQERLDYQGNHISDLLNMKFKQSLNENLQLFLTDLFLGSPNYKNGLLSVSLIFLILSRLAQNSNQLNDLLEALRKNLGDDKFKFYMENHFLLVLDSYNQTFYYIIYQQALKSYQISLEQRSKLEWQSISPLDSYFIQSEQVYVDYDYASKSEPMKYSINQYYDLKLTSGQNIQKQQKEMIDSINFENIVAQLQDETKTKFKNDTDPISTVSRFISKDYINKTKYYQYPKIQSKNQSQGSLSQTPKFQFSTKPDQSDSSETKSIGAGFMRYLQKAKEIDTSKRSAQSQANYQVKSDTPFLQPKLYESKQQINSTDNKKKDQKIQTLFANIETNSQQDMEQTQKKPQSQQTKYEAWFKNPEKLTQATLDIQHIFLDDPPIDLLIQRIEEYYPNIIQTENNNLYQTLALLNRLNTEPNGQLILLKLFCDPVTTKQNPQLLNSNLDLKILFETKFGVIEKDYRNYLGDFIIFPYEIPFAMYDMLLDQISMSETFHRRQFKKIIAHIGAFSKEINESTLDLIIKIILQQRIPLSLLEIVNIFMKRNIKLTQTQFFQILDTLQRFKQIDEECEPLLATAYDHYSWDIEYSTFQKYVDKLISSDQTIRHLYLYELLKDIVLLSKKKIEKPNLTRKDIITNYALQYVNNLLQYEQIDAARKVLANVRGLKTQQSEEFHCAWLHAHANLPEEAIKIFQDHTEKYRDLIDDKYIIKICLVIQKSPTRLLEFFGIVTSEWVFSRKVQLTSELIHILSATFMITKEYTSFTTLIKVIHDENLQMDPITRNVWIKIMKRCSDNAQKGQIKGAIDQIFGQKEKETKKQKPYVKETSQSKETEKIKQQKIIVNEEKIPEIDESNLMKYKEFSGKKEKSKLRYNKSNFLNTSQEDQASSAKN